MPSSTTAQATVWSIPGGSGSGEVSGSGDASGSGGATSGTASAVLPTTLPGNCCKFAAAYDMCECVLGGEPEVVCHNYNTVNRSL